VQLLEVLLDSDVMIDILRDYSPAVEWLKALRDQKAKICLPGFAVMELIQGCENKEQIKEVREDVQDFRVLWPTESTCSKALEAYARYSLSHGLDILDALIDRTDGGRSDDASSYIQYEALQRRFQGRPGSAVQTRLSLSRGRGQKAYRKTTATNVLNSVANSGP
jgi:predicted nucleic acid-binding protein